MADSNNFPEPKTAAERIVLKGAELLDQDVFGKLGRQQDDGTWVEIWGATFYNVGRETLSVKTDATVDGPWHVVGVQTVSKSIASVFNQAFASAMMRQRERDLERVEQRMVKPSPAFTPAPKPNNPWPEIIGIFVLLLIGLFAIGFLGFLVGLEVTGLRP